MAKPHRPGKEALNTRNQHHDIPVLVGTSAKLFPELKSSKNRLVTFDLPADTIKQAYQIYPKVRNNKNTKTISITGYLDLNTIKIKVIADKNDWLALEKTYEAGDTLTLANIRPYIRASKENYRRLKQYYNENQNNFAWEFYTIFIEEATRRIKIIRPRGGSPYLQSSDKMMEIRQICNWIYLFLSYWSKKPKNEFPQNLKRYLIKNKESELTPEQVLSFTMEIIRRQFDLNLTKMSLDSFYKKYIANKKGSLKRIKRALETINYLPKRPPLSEIF